MNNPKPTSLDTMKGHGKCHDGQLCSYHEGKVNNSVCPSPEVYGVNHLEQISIMLNEQDTEDISVEELMEDSLKLVDEYWKNNKHDLKTNDIANHRAEYNEAQKDGRYLAGGWMASPQQFSQLFTAMWVLNAKGQLDSNSEVLRLGTASGAHSQQLNGVFPIIDPNLNPALSIMDMCDAPLKDSEHVTDKLICGDIVSGMREAVNEASMDIVTGHVITSFIPAKGSEEARDHEKSLAAKLKLFSNARHVLKLGGCMCMCIGTSPNDPRRFNNKDEIVKVIEDAGFRDITIVETTDPLDFSDGNYDPGNFVVVAFK
ncbi:hypothetical protein GF354_01265 [Candidatus Peregrinibacteria bacterium]|nr:hypothetical protein [Candidatus Peregrinibacteria bacterium]